MCLPGVEFAQQPLVQGVVVGIVTRLALAPMVGAPDPRRLGMATLTRKNPVTTAKIRAV